MTCSDYMSTFTGRPWFPYDPSPRDVHLEDLQAASRVCRFSGHCTEPYSVAEHCVRVARAISANGGSDRLVLAGLLHDIHEAYPPGDVPAPVKHADTILARELRAMERLAQSAVLMALTGDPWFCDSPVVKHFDLVLLATEKRDIMAPGVKWGPLPEPLPEVIWPWSYDKAWERWLDMYNALRGPALRMAA